MPAGFIDYLPYNPGPNPIPTMSEYLLVVMVLILAFAAFRFLRSPLGGPLASVLAAAVVFTGLSVNPVIEGAWATIANIYLDQQQGGTKEVGCQAALIASDPPVFNATTVPQRITALRTSIGAYFDTSVPNPCQVGTILQPNSANSCNVIVVCPPPP